jgi:hypothetical protein
MYDLKNDPYELNNLVDDLEYAAKKEKLKAQLEAMRKDLGESIPLKGRLPDPVQLPGMPRRPSSQAESATGAGRRRKRHGAAKRAETKGASEH